MPSTSTAVSRLMKEFQNLQRNPITRANAHPVGDNLLTWKMIIVGEAPYDFPIRIHLDYSEDYPNAAPKAYFETHMPFVGGASIIADNGLQSVCLNIFGNFAFVHTEWKSQQEGWTPAYTIETIITSIQGLMMEDMLDKNPREIEKARKLALGFQCKTTGHDGSSQKKWWPEVNMDLPVAKKDGEEKKGSSPADKARALIDNHYICYVLKGCPDDKRLGFGIGIEGFKTKSFSSPCEVLSKEAFTKLNVRQSSTNKSIAAWCPIVTPFKGWSDVKSDFYSCMADCAKEANQGAYHKVQTPLSVCLSIMNSLVVEVMNSANNLTANDKFIEGYFAFLKLLSHHIEDHPECAKFVDDRIKKFADSPDMRVKNVTSNLGEFILYPLLSNKYGWKDVSTPYINECHSRCVFWYVQGSRQQPGRLPELKKQGAKHRPGLVYDATETSRRLVCYQVGFSSTARKFLAEQRRKAKLEKDHKKKATTTSATATPPQEEKAEGEMKADAPAEKKVEQQQPKRDKKNPWGKKADKKDEPAPATAGGANTPPPPAPQDTEKPQEQQQSEPQEPVPETELVPESVKATIKGMHKDILKMKTWDEYYTFLGVATPKDMDAVLWSAVEASKKAGYHK